MIILPDALRAKPSLIFWLMLALAIAPGAGWADDPTPNKRLLTAAADGNTAEVNDALMGGANINTTDKWGRTPLMLAAAWGRPEVIRILIEHEPDVNLRDVHGNTALLFAAQRKGSEPAGWLLYKGADVNATNDDGNSPLIYAVQTGDSTLVYFMLAFGAHVNTKNNMGRTALMEATLANHGKAILWLLKNGADVNARDKDGWTALMLAAGHGHHPGSSIREAVITSAGRIVAPSLTDLSSKALAWAKSQRQALDTEAVKLFLDKGADANVKGNKGMTALKLAKRRGAHKMARLLVEHGAKE